MSKAPVQYRQGDVFLEKVEKIPSEATEVNCKKDGRVILMFGSATGHAHAFALKDVKLFKTADGQRYLDVKPGAKLVHDEHDAIEVQTGFYSVGQQREYAPDAIRNVAD
jgi:hypothetical protein